MIQESQILDKLRTVDQYHFEELINQLLYQGAFPDVVAPESFLEPFGTNPEKERTIKSSPRADAEVRSLGTVVEKSVNENWEEKFKSDIKKNKDANKQLSRFVFCTNQDSATKIITINNEKVDAVEYCKKELRCNECFIIGKKDILLRLQNPEYFYIRRRYLDISGDFFISPTAFLKEIRQNSSLSSNVEEESLKQFGGDIDQSLSFSAGGVVILHNDDYVTLLHAVGMWAESKLITNSTIEREYCFINWPRTNADLQNVDYREIAGDLESVIVIWGAHEITNLSEYLKFHNAKALLIFVTKTSFKDELVLKRLSSFGELRGLREISIATIDQRSVSPDELKQHESKVQGITQSTVNLLLRFEALIYYYSPLHVKDKEKIKKMMRILEIKRAQLNQLKDMLLTSDLADTTGDIIWLKQAGVAKKLLDDFISAETFPIDELI